MLDINAQLIYAVKMGANILINNLIHKGARVDTKDEDGRTPLHIAAENNRLKTADILLQHGANLEAQMNDGGTPVMDAAAMGHNDMVYFLINKGARLHVTDNCEWNLLHWTASEDHPTTAELIIEYAPELVNTMMGGVDIMPLHLAKSPAMAKVLLDNGAMINACNDDGETILHIATDKGNIGLVKFLMDYDANILQIDRWGKSSIYIAMTNQRHDIIALYNDKILPKDGRKRTTYADNVTMALNPATPLDHEAIIEHAQRRIDLFFYTLIAYYKTGLTTHISETDSQHGKGTVSTETHACHSAILPALWDTMHTKSPHRYDTRNQPNEFNYKTSILHNTHFQKSLNSTVGLHRSVNYFDSYKVEGREAGNNLRNKSLAIY